MLEYKDYNEEEICERLSDFIEEYMDDEDTGWRDVLDELVCVKPFFTQLRFDEVLDSLVEFIKKGTLFGVTPYAISGYTDRNGWMNDYTVSLTGDMKIRCGTIKFQSEDGEWTSYENLYTG